MSPGADDIPPKLDKSLLLLFGIVAITVVLFAIGSLGFITRSPQPRARAEAEIAALCAALESYKADHGQYPSNADTKRLRPDTHFSPGDYIASSKFLYYSLSGVAGGPVYFEFRPSLLARDTNGEMYIVDPKGRSYGYSTAGVKNGTNSFDLWSTAGGAKATATNQWIANW